MNDRLVYYLDNQAPAIRRRLDSSTGTLNITNQVFRLKARPMWTSSITLDVEMESVPDTDELIYEPIDGDFDSIGIYRAWIEIDSGGKKQDTEEFEIVVMAHAPGGEAPVGEVWRACRALAPVAWDNLLGYADYGNTELQRIIELAKLRVYNRHVSVSEESGLDLRVIDYIAKKVLVDNALEAAIDYWKNVIVSQTANANSAEVKTYPDRIRASEAQLERLRAQLDGQKSEVDAILGVSSGIASRSPMLVNGGPHTSYTLDEIPGVSVICEPREEIC